MNDVFIDKNRVYSRDWIDMAIESLERDNWAVIELLSEMGLFK